MPHSGRSWFRGNMRRGYHAVEGAEANALGSSYTTTVYHWKFGVLGSISLRDHVHRTSYLVTWAFLVFSMILILVLTALAMLGWPSPGQARRCVNPTVRREWRSLTSEERTEFTRAFNCLSKVPSVWGRNGTIYDDFAALHGGIGSWCMYPSKHVHGIKSFVS